jgi:uncharacterized cupredoxin-like copper-binding protein
MFKHLGRGGIVAAVLALTLAMAACGGNDSSNTGDNGGGGDTGGGAAGTTVGATEKDFAIALDSTDLSSGSTTFEITNEGPSTHEFVVVKTDLAPESLPTKKGGSEVDENSKKIDPIDEVEDIAPGSTPSMTVDLDAGSYVAFCNLPGHYSKGMHAGLSVS